MLASIRRPHTPNDQRKREYRRFPTVAPARGHRMSKSKWIEDHFRKRLKDERERQGLK
jgi:hypothetical protein